MSACVGLFAESSRSSVTTPGAHRVLYQAMRNAGREVHTGHLIEESGCAMFHLLRYTLRSTMLSS
jgi:hypothetical protein